MPSVLIVDDEPNIRRMVGALLAADGYEVRDAPDGHQAFARAQEAEPDVVLLDLMMPNDTDGLETLAKFREKWPELPVVMMSGRAGLSDAVKATRLGAFTFLEKPLTPEGTLLALASALDLRQTRRAARTLREDLGIAGGLVGESPAMAQVRALIARVAPSDARVLISGESGTGKELVAGALHAGSPRRDKAYVRTNCAAIPRDLVESEMFGHERGAFTGATERRIGRFELAHAGTLFLDEVGDLQSEAQAKLLRAIEAREIERVGGAKPIKVDVRIVAATNRNLEAAVADGSFREDLFFRLNVIPMTLPPLRERIEDLDALVLHFTALHRTRTGRAAPTFTVEAMAALRAHRWPGNVRELANIVERLAILYPGRELRVGDVDDVLPAPRLTSDAGAARASRKADGPPLPLSDALDAYERQLIARAMDDAQGNVAEAARALQTDRPNLYRRMKRLGVGGGMHDARGEA
jgi:two-component system, NtrC family, nitrogen regulation response regulator NtrX